jgi:outer membrane murein-binding lipoprotein Lpp
VPGVHHDSGPRILTMVELNDEYDKFLVEVDGELADPLVRDFEGDPRDGRITPNTFLKWSVGAVRGDRYEFRTVEQLGEGEDKGDENESRLLGANLSPLKLSFGSPVSSIDRRLTTLELQTTAQAATQDHDHGQDLIYGTPRGKGKQVAGTGQHSWQAMKQTPRRRSAELPKLTITVPQYDRNTGEPISPAYSLDESPIPMLSPAGINMRACPNQFAYSYPHAHRQHNRDEIYDAGLDAYSDAPDVEEGFTNVSDDLLSISPRKPKQLLTSPQKGLLLALAAFNGPAAPNTLTTVRAAIQGLIQSRDNSTSQANRAAAISRELSAQVDVLEMEVTLLRTRIKFVEQEEERIKLEAERARLAEQQTKQHKRHAEMVNEYMEHLCHERNKADVARMGFEEFNEKLRQRAGGLVVERNTLRDRMGGIELGLNLLFDDDARRGRNGGVGGERASGIVGGIPGFADDEGSNSATRLQSLAHGIEMTLSNGGQIEK